MRIFLSLSLALILGIACLPVIAQNTQDRSITVTHGQAEKFRQQIKPYSEKAKATYPQAKARFLKGLPAGCTFYITAVITDSSGKFEQTFIKVQKIVGSKITGSIANEIEVVSGYKYGDPYNLSESDIVDWTITDPQGNEEGNFVGKFLDGTYDDSTGANGSVWRKSPKTSAGLIAAIKNAASEAAPYGPIPRIALYDIGYPRSSAEAASLDSNAVMLLTAFAQTPDDLPLKRLYILSGGVETDLKMIDDNLSSEEVTPEVTKMFGKYRYDALYLLPISLRKAVGEMRAVFGSGRDIKITDLGTPLAKDVADLNIGPGTGKGPSRNALDIFIKREFPAFSVK